MKAKNARATAQVIALSKFSGSDKYNEGEEMKKQHISSECYKKLNRSSAVAGYINLDLSSRPVNGIHQLYVPHLFSYIHDDIAEALEELKEKGLCDEWIKQPQNN